MGQMRGSRDRNYHRHLGHSKNSSRIRGQENEINQLQPSLIQMGQMGQENEINQVQPALIQMGQMRSSRDRNDHPHLGHSKNSNRIQCQETEINQLQPALIQMGQM